MAQAPATPKIRRALNLLLAGVTSGHLPRRTTLALSERAALDLRGAEAPDDAAQMVTFLIPLVGPGHVGDWGAVEARLAATLRAFQAQSDKRWQAVVCCQVRPQLPDDPRVTFLPFDDPTPGNDKWRKLAALCQHLPNLPPVAGYVMPFDADDLLHPDTVQDMLRGQARGGYLVQAGYVFDHATQTVGLAGRPTLALPLRKPFWKLCGSCCALRHGPGTPLTTAFLHALTQHEHRMFPYLARLAGRRLTPMSRPAVLYVLNHGENFGARRGRVSFKARFVRRFQVTDPQTLGAIRQDFPDAWATDHKDLG